MDFKVLIDEKEELKVQIGNITSVEILRVYLNHDDKVTFAVWKLEHPSKKTPILHIKTKGKTARKALSDAIAKIEKDTEKIVEEFKKAK
jgi:DNA-directed RNA polymerase subunit L